MENQLFQRAKIVSVYIVLSDIVTTLHSLLTTHDSLLTTHYVCVCHAPALWESVPAVYTRPSHPKGRADSYSLTELAALVRMAAAPRRRVQKHSKRREGCPPLKGRGRGDP